MTTEIESTEVTENLSPAIRDKAQALRDAVGDSFGEIVIKAADGTIDRKASKRVMLGALSLYLRSVGELKSPGRKPREVVEVDNSNIHNALYFAFLKNAKGEDPKLSLGAVLNATAIVMSVPVEDFDRAKRDIRKALESHSMLAIEKGASKFDGTNVVLVGPPTNPAAFAPWGAPVAPVAPVVAPTPAPVAEASHAPEQALSGKPRKVAKVSQTARA